MYFGAHSSCFRRNTERGGDVGLTIQLQERPDLGSGSWQDVDMHGKPVSVDAEGRVHLRVPPKGNSAFYRLVNKGEEE